MAEYFYINYGKALADTRTLSTEEFGAYVVLVAQQMKSGGILRLSDKQIARMLNSNVRRWSRLKSELEDNGFLEASDSGIRLIGDWFRHRKPNAPRPSIPKAIRQKVMDIKSCLYCGCTDGPFEIDHMHPVSRGGSDDPDNLCCACKSCNRSKGAKTLEEWMGA